MAPLLRAMAPGYLDCDARAQSALSPFISLGNCLFGRRSTIYANFKFTGCADAIRIDSSRLC